MRTPWDGHTPDELLQARDGRRHLRDALVLTARRLDAHQGLQRTQPVRSGGRRFAAVFGAPRVSAAIRAIAACALLCGIATPGFAQLDPGVAHTWIEEMKQSPQGPFGGIGWFCVDGAVLGPRAGCSAHGGGIQHGTWSERTRQLRADE